MNRILSLGLLMAALCGAQAATPNVRVSLPALDVEALLDATVTLVPMQTAAPTASLFLTLPTLASEGGVCTFTNVPAGRYRLHAAGSGVADLLIIVPDTSGEVLAEACIDPTANFTAPAPVRRSYINPRGTSVLWPATNGLAGQAILDDGTGALYFGAAGGGGGGGWSTNSDEFGSWLVSQDGNILVDLVGGTIYVGTNSAGTFLNPDGSGEALMSYRDTSKGEPNFNAVYIGVTDGDDEFSDVSMDAGQDYGGFTMDQHDGARRASLFVTSDADEAGQARVSLEMRVNTRTMVMLEPSLVSLTATPYILDTLTNRTGLLLSVRHNSVEKLSVATNGVLHPAGGMPTNAAAATITTNQFVLDTLYTNFAQRALVQCAITMTNVAATDKCQVSIWVDQDADGSWERTGNTVRLQGVAALAGTSQLTAWLQPGARFIITNQSVTGGASIVGNSSSWIQQ